MPSRETVRRWLRDKAEFRGQYARAREDQADALADEILAIADDTDGDVEIVEGEIVQIAANVNRAKLRVDARKWAAGKLAPKKYGTKVELSGDADNPIVTRIERVIVDPKNPDTESV